MQSLKIVLRAVGAPSPNGDIVSSNDVEEYIQYQYLSKGYTLKSEHYLGAVKNASGADEGYRILFILVREDTPPAVLAEDKKAKEK